MVLESSGIQIEEFYLPAFALCAGEIITCFLYGGAHFYKLQMQLAAILTGKEKNANVKIYKPVTFVEHVKTRSLSRLFYPTTVAGLIKRYGNTGNDFKNRIYHLSGIHSKTILNSLNGSELKLMSLYCALSFTKNVVLDLVGVSPVGCKMVLQVLEENADNGGSAVILDNSSDLKYESSRFLTIEILDK